MVDLLSLSWQFSGIWDISYHGLEKYRRKTFEQI